MDYISQIETNGYVVIENLFSRIECKDASNELDTLFAKYSNYHADVQAAKSELANKQNEKVVYNLHNKSEMFWKFFQHKIVLDCASKILGHGSYQSSEPYYLSNISARNPLKNNPGQQLHTDSNLPGVNYPLIMNVLWALEPFTLENGATRVVPGSHRRMEYPANGIKYADEVQLVCPAGSVIVFNANLWHAGGPNVSGDSRWALVLSYARWFIKPAFDFTRNTPVEKFNSWTLDQKKLLGFDLNPPSDEFTRIRRRSENPELLLDSYRLPK